MTSADLLPRLRHPSRMRTSCEVCGRKTFCRRQCGLWLCLSWSCRPPAPVVAPTCRTSVPVMSPSAEATTGRHTLRALSTGVPVPIAELRRGAWQEKPPPGAELHRLGLCAFLLTLGPLVVVAGLLSDEVALGLGLVIFGLLALGAAPYLGLKEE